MTQWDPCIDCNVFKAKNPTFINFVMDDGPNYNRDSNMIYGAAVDFAKKTLVPTFIVMIKNDDEKAHMMSKFGLDDRFPCMTAWSMGKLVSQTTPNALYTLTPITASMHMMELLDYISLLDVKAYRMMQAYKDLKKIEEEGGDVYGRTGNDYWRSAFRPV